MWKILCMFIFLSCSTLKGPNYNQGRTHNESTSLRNKIVMKEDARSKKQMKNTRKRASRGKHVKKSRKRVRRII